MHRLLDGGGLERLGRGRRLGPDLDRSIGVEGVALGVVALRLELVDDRLGNGVLARIGVEGHQGAFAGRAGNRPELLVDQRVAAHQRGLDRTSVVSGKSVSVRVYLGGRRNLKKKKKKT